jgi:hypothetical protein
MPYAVVEDVPASWERYAPIAAMLEPVPAGLLLHVAGPTDEGFRIIEIWESEAAWHAFSRGRNVFDALDPDLPIEPTRRTVRATHVVAGPIDRAPRQTTS